MTTWNEADHPRVPSGSSKGGEFTTKEGIASATSAARSAAGLSNEPDTLKEFLERMAKLSAGRGFEAYVLKNGRSYQPAPLPEGIEVETPKECFKNAANLAESNPEEYTYVEGFAFPDFMEIPIQHAWVVDKSGRVIDNTWPTPGQAYFGVEVPIKKLLEVLVESGTYGVFGYERHKIH